jgi:hypothetical protein
MRAKKRGPFCSKVLLLHLAGRDVEDEEQPWKNAERNGCFKINKHGQD